MAKLTSFQKKTTSFVTVMKERLGATNRQKYLNINVLMRIVIALKDYYQNEMPSHTQSKDKEEFSSILSDKLKKSLARYQVPKVPSFFEDISDSDEPPVKKPSTSLQSKTQLKKPSSTITCPPNNPVYSSSPYAYYQYTSSQMQAPPSARSLSTICKPPG